MYSVHGDYTLVSSYKVKEDGTLEHLNTIDIGGKNPVDVTVDKDNRHFRIVATSRRNIDIRSSGQDAPGRGKRGHYLHMREGRRKGIDHPSVSLGSEQELHLRLCTGKSERIRTDESIKVQP